MPDIDLSSETPDQLSKLARAAWRYHDWKALQLIVQALKQKAGLTDIQTSELHFLEGLGIKNTQNQILAIPSFRSALHLDSARYDAAIELAAALLASREPSESFELVTAYQPALNNSPIYLNMAATTLVDLGFPARAEPLYRRAVELQPEVELFTANLAACCIFTSNEELSRELYQKLLEKQPGHQRHLYQLSRLTRGVDQSLVERIKSALKDNTGGSDDTNVFAYYALAKQYEDLGDWDRAFHYFSKAGSAITDTLNYKVDEDIDVLEGARKLEVSEAPNSQVEIEGKVPIFVVGLPRTGTTLVEQLLASHSSIETIGETNHIESTVLSLTGYEPQYLSKEIMRQARLVDPMSLRQEYYRLVSYRLSDKHYFVEKMPSNFLFLPLILSAFPEAKVILLERNPIDACFAMFKQLFTWAYRFSYSIENLRKYYVAYHELILHFKEQFPDRIVPIKYEELVANPENKVPELFAKLDIPYEPEVLTSDRSTVMSMTASALQVRNQISTSSVDRWKRYETHLEALKPLINLSH